MPIYEFNCSVHGKFEQLLNRITDNTECPKCGHSAPKIMSKPAPAVIKMAVHTDSGIPMDVHKTLKHKNEERWDVIRREQKVILPEDM